MTTAAEHYEHHLGPIYVWMAGGSETALQAGSAEIEALNLPVTQGAVVLDLGAGFGMHSIPLARRGARVTSYTTLFTSAHRMAGKLGSATIASYGCHLNT